MQRRRAGSGTHGFLGGVRGERKNKSICGSIYDMPRQVETVFLSAYSPATGLVLRYGFRDLQQRTWTTGTSHRRFSRRPDQ